MDAPKSKHLLTTKTCHNLCLCCSSFFLFTLFPFFLLLFLFTSSSSFSFISSISPTISLPSQCRIVSTSVDLKSSKVCELGLLNYNAKYVLHGHAPKFRCRYDYYWASIFKVEYKEHSSGQRRYAFAEAPKEALPIDCRPNFGAAWLTKEKFRVNGTYFCRYTPGLSHVDIFSDSHFKCHAKDPSTAEMTRRYSILFMRLLKSSFSSKGRTMRAVLHSVAGIFTGILTALFFSTLVKVLQLLKFSLPRILEARKLHMAIKGTCIRRTLFLVAYLSIMGYLTIQYVKMLGLTKTFTSS